MLYRELRPSAPLRRHVSCVWILDHAPEPDPAPEKILPDGRPELIFNLGAPYRRVEADGAAGQPTAFVVGQIRRYLEVLPAGHVSMIGVRLEATALHHMLGRSMSELTDRTVALADLERPWLLQLEERLHDARDWPARVRLVEACLLERLHGAPGPTGEALDLIRRAHGGLDLARVAGAVGVSTRTLDRRFAAEVGLTPKFYSRQVRLQRALQLLSAAPRPSLAEVALASGCFDQAHLNREFQAFAGESPAAFLRGRHELSDHLTGMA